MIAKHIHLEHLPRILSNKPLLEHFLSVLLDKTVELPCWPKEIPWDFCYPFAICSSALEARCWSLSAQTCSTRNIW